MKIFPESPLQLDESDCRRIRLWLVTSSDVTPNKTTTKARNPAMDEKMTCFSSPMAIPNAATSVNDRRTARAWIWKALLLAFGCTVPESLNLLAIVGASAMGMGTALGGSPLLYDLVDISATDGVASKIFGG